MESSPPKPTYDELLATVARLEKRLDSMENELANTKDELIKTKDALAAAKKNSGNSSKPPSSDIVKPKEETKTGRKKRGKRKIGGQPGHPKHERTFNLSAADEKHDYTLDECPLGGTLALIPLPAETKILYQYELVEKPVLLHAHMACAYWCEDCDEIHYGKIPPEIRKGGLVGSRLTALIGCLKGGCHASYSTTQKFLQDVLGARLSEGMLTKVVQKVSRSLASPYQELLDRLWTEKYLNIDETGHKENGKRWWNWCFRALAFTVFHIADSRGSAVLERVLGRECEAVIGSDHFSAYRKYMKDAPIEVQFCLAHLIRELKFLTESSTPAIAAYGDRLLVALKKIFRLIHKREHLLAAVFRTRMEVLRDDFLKMAKRTQAGGGARVLAKRFRTYGSEYFTFITHPGIDPTNNVAERAIRFTVIDRKITQGTRGLNGRQWSERIWTTMATCSQQGRSAFTYITASVQALFSKTEAPSLLPPN